MAVSRFSELVEHIGHEIVCVGYGPLAQPPVTSVAVECETCGSVLFDYEYGEGEDE